MMVIWVSLITHKFKLWPTLSPGSTIRHQYIQPASCVQIGHLTIHNSFKNSGLGPMTLSSSHSLMDSTWSVLSWLSASPARNVMWGHFSILKVVRLVRFRRQLGSEKSDCITNFRIEDGSTSSVEQVSWGQWDTFHSWRKTKLFHFSTGTYLSSLQWTRYIFLIAGSCSGNRHPSILIKLWHQLISSTEREEGRLVTTLRFAQPTILSSLKWGRNPTCSQKGNFNPP